MRPEAINAEAIAAQLHEYEVTVDDVLKTLKTVKHEEYYEAYKAALSVSLWDKASPINGIEAARVLEGRFDVTTEHDVVLIKDGAGKVIYFQPILKSDHPSLALDNMIHAAATNHANAAVTREVTNLLARAYWDGNPVEK